MNDDMQTNPNPDPSTKWTEMEDLAPASMRELVISRVIDGSASPEDWSVFRSVASKDPSVWSELSEAQREHEALNEVMNQASAIADRVALPIGNLSTSGSREFERRVSVVGQWGGWAIAAVLMFGWFTGSIVLNPKSVIEDDGSSTQPVTAGMIPVGHVALEEAGADEAFNQYIEAGQSSGMVVGEMPDHIVVETRPLGNGTVEVIYLRQVVERRVLDRAYREATNEFGDAVVVPVDLRSLERRVAH